MLDEYESPEDRVEISIFDEIKYQVTQICNMPDIMEPEPEGNYLDICKDIFGAE